MAIDELRAKGSTTAWLDVYDESGTAIPTVPLSLSTHVGD
jgi:hypothetical protein